MLIMLILLIMFLFPPGRRLDRDGDVCDWSTLDVLVFVVHGKKRSCGTCVDPSIAGPETDENVDGDGESRFTSHGFELARPPQFGGTKTCRHRLFATEKHAHASSAA